MRTRRRASRRSRAEAHARTSPPLPNALMSRGHYLRPAWDAASIWIGRQHLGWDIWDLAYVAERGGPYLRLTHKRTRKHWQLDQIEDWRRIQGELGALLERVETGKAVGTRAVPSPSSSATASNTPGALVTCPQCGVAVKLSNLPSHLTKCPHVDSRAGGIAMVGVPAPRAKRGTSTTAAWTPGMRDGGVGATPRTGVLPEHVGRPDPRDASKGVGHLVRDHGRYGSFPVHDGYGEEADA